MVLGAVVAILVAVLAVVVLSGDSLPAVASCGLPEEMAVVLETIRTQESGGNYTARSGGSTASGAYQFLDTTWSGYGGYPSAYMAPATVQDAKATEWVTGILAANGGAISAVPVTWYIGFVPPARSPVWDQVPYPDAGNTITPRQYVDRWLTMYASKSPSSTTSTTILGIASTTVAGMVVDSCRVTPTLDGFALPVPRDGIAARPELLDVSHHDYPAWDYPTPIGTPVFAVHAGTVSQITNSSNNCYPDGLNCDKCGLGVTVTDDDGVQWVYCHASELAVVTGATVAAGERIMTSGNSGFSTGPHLHFGIRISGVDHCPQPLLRAIFETGHGIAATVFPTTGCSSGHI